MPLGASLSLRIAFGDSYTSVQGTAGYPNFSSIGSYLPEQFSFLFVTLLSNKTVQNFTGTAEDGPNWLWYFAFAGADVSLQHLRQHHDFAIPLVNQTRQYLIWAEPVIGKGMDKSKALVVFWIGINDTNDSSNFTNMSFPAFYNELIDTMFIQSARPMYMAGYRNFLFINLPPLNRTAAKCRKNKDVTAMVYDANKFLNGVLDDPEHSASKTRHRTVWTTPIQMPSQTHKIMTPDIARFLQG
ncbi:hypothetical protein F4801DRAFT_590675 [Xylaria longipes]|nr:hypothetical protein F4801DRAFT_590675 [Xylaria longipes]